MQEYIARRCVEIAQYVVSQRATVRQAAAHFKLSKSSVHKDINERLSMVHGELYRQAQSVLCYNKAVRHLRGGAATKRKYIDRKQKCGDCNEQNMHNSCKSGA